MNSRRHIPYLRTGIHYSATAQDPQTALEAMQKEPLQKAKSNLEAQCTPSPWHESTKKHRCSVQGASSSDFPKPRRHREPFTGLFEFLTNVDLLGHRCGGMVCEYSSRRTGLLAQN